MFSDSHIRGNRLIGVVIVLMLTLSAAILTMVSALPRIVRRNRALLQSGAAKRYNDITRKSAGTPRSPFALLTHVGRRSGRTYQTALGALAYGDGYLLPLGYGTETDWYRNVMAAGKCQLAWKGTTHQLERPELISGYSAVRAWPLRQRITLRLAGIGGFVWLHAQTRR